MSNTNPFTYCIRKGFPLCVSREDLLKYQKDEHGAVQISKDVYLMRKYQIRECLNSNCRVYLKPFENGYCLDCQHSNNFEYAVDETINKEIN